MSCKSRRCELIDCKIHKVKDLKQNCLDILELFQKVESDASKDITDNYAAMARLSKNLRSLRDLAHNMRQTCLKTKLELKYNRVSENYRIGASNISLEDYKQKRKEQLEKLRTSKISAKYVVV